MIHVHVEWKVAVLGDPVTTPHSASLLSLCPVNCVCVFCLSPISVSCQLCMCVLSVSYLCILSTVYVCSVCLLSLCPVNCVCVCFCPVPEQQIAVQEATPTLHPLPPVAPTFVRGSSGRSSWRVVPNNDQRLSQVLGKEGDVVAVTMAEEKGEGECLEVM